MKTFIVATAVIIISILQPSALRKIKTIFDYFYLLEQQNQIPNFQEFQNQIPNFQEFQNQIPNFQQALDQLKNFGNQEFSNKSTGDLKIANTELNTNIKSLKQKGQAIQQTVRAAIKKSLKGLKDRMGELTQTQQKKACETMADNASTKGANTQDFQIRNQGCAKLASSLADLQIEQYATNKRIGRFVNSSLIPPTTTQFTFGNGKISTQFIKELCGTQECSVNYQNLTSADVTFPGIEFKGAQRVSVTKRDGTLLSKRSANANSVVQASFDGPCPELCLVAPGDSSDFEQGDNICTKVEFQGKCIVKSNETSTYAIGDFSLRSFGYWFLGIVATAAVLVI